MSRCGVAGWGGTPAALKSAWWDQSFIGWKGSWQQSFEGLRTWDERKLLKLMPTSALERRAAIQPPLPARTTQTATHTHGKHAFISKHTNTDSGHHAYMYFLKSSTHSHRQHILASFLTLSPRDDWSWGTVAAATSRTNTSRAWSGWKHRAVGK